MKKTFLSPQLFLSFLTVILLNACNLDTIRPSSNQVSDAPSSLNMKTPNAVLGNLSTPVVTVGGVTDGAIVKLYSANDCSVSSLIGTATATSSSVDITTSTLVDGNTYHFYAASEKASGPATACSTASITYTYQKAAKISFSKDAYTIDRLGTSVGASITVTRDAPGVAQSVTLTTDHITTNSGDLTASPITVNFTANATSVIVPVSTFTLFANGSIIGDKFFRIRLSAPNNFGVLTFQSDAQVNLLDSQLGTKYFFSKSLYSTTEGSAAIVNIQRAGSTTDPETVQVKFINGTAIGGGTDFDSTPLTVNFASGVREMPVSIPTVNNGVAKDNRSFYIELKNPSAGGLRPWATAKVRILDNDDTTLCDATNNNPAIDDGFGGGVGTLANPYRICSITQLYHLRANATLLGKAYRIMADLDLDPSIDADSTTPGVPYTPVTSDFTGQLNGDEHILKNFRYTQTSYVNAVGFFYSVAQSSSAKLSAINFIQASLISTANDVIVGGIVGKVINSIDRFTDLHFSGYVKNQGNASAAGALGAAETIMTGPLTRIFTTGSVISSNRDGGGIVGAVGGNASSNLESCYSTATVGGYVHSGGLVGIFAYAYAAQVSISNSHGKGVVIGLDPGAEIGGILGYGNASSGVYNMTNIESSAILTGGANLGGVTGTLICPTDATCNYTNVNSTAKIVSSSNGFIGGVIGYANVNTVNLSTFDQVRFDGTLTFNVAPNNSAGLFGRFDVNSNVTISHSHSGANLTNTDAAGGIIGRAFLKPGMRLEISNTDATGNITSQAGAVYSVGGLVGSINTFDSGAQPTIVIENSFATGNITSFANIGGLVGSIQAASESGLDLTIRNVYATGNVVGDRSTGGLIGTLMAESLSHGVSHYVVENAYATGNVSVNSQFGGALIGYLGCNKGGPQSIEFSKVFTTGNLNTTNTGNSMGGLIGVVFDGNTGTDPCSFTFTNTSSSGTIRGQENVGGLFGQINFNHGATASFTDSYTRSPLFSNTPSSTEGLGVTNTPISYTRVFWRKDTVNSTLNDDTHQRTETALQTPSTYGSWSTPPWNISSGSYPTLSW